MKKLLNLFLIFAFIFSFNLIAQDDNEENKENPLDPVIGGLKWRSIGPAFTSGRIADFAVNPENTSIYYVATASGNIWKTTNSGITFDPIFDNYGAYSIGVIEIDPNNPYVIWTGTGENNHQRALGYGNGVYKSTDEGKSWENMGLKNSRQIGGIVIDPRNSDIVFVAAEGSVWGPGGDRGLYKTTNGGKDWKKVLEISENTGVNNVIYDPRNPDVMYATSEQRRRHVYTKIGGGPESAVYKSVDGGENWNKIMKGLPKVDIGGMGIDISPANPDILYLIMEAAEDKGGFFKSTDRGATWKKQNSYHASGQYYNEIYCDPVDVNKVYSMNTVTRITLDGGKTWDRLGRSNRHVDDHALWINPLDTDHLLIGGDGGVYETFDGADNWDFKENLPITQFYRVEVDNSYPFYYVYGGTQDNNSMGGPSQTLNSDGIVNSDWFITNGGDGFWTDIDPEEPNIVYAEAQYGNMVRYDKQSGEAVDIRPEPGKDELTYKWNWDTPLFISPHSNKRLYCAANFVFRSDDRGNSWKKISPDLTTQTDRNQFPVMGKYWSIDAVAKDKSTSLWGTIISLTESPVKENLLYAGTDDGLIHISEDAKNWTNISDFPGVPEYTYVSDILPSKFDENIVFASFDNIKRDDFKPYLLKSTNKGKSWFSIAGNLPEGHTIHSIEQDYENPDLLFVGTEFGIWATVDGGENWTQMKKGLPTISVKDIAIQKREDDLVIATFGRGFYIIDDYSPLRYINKDLIEKDAHLFAVPDALMYVQQRGRYGQGATFYKADNPEFGAAFTYYIKEVPKTLKEIRKEKEKELFKKGEPIPQPSDEELLKEKQEIAPYLVFTITDEDGNIVRKITKSASKGLHRINWDLKYHGYFPVDDVSEFDPVKEAPSSTLALPGKYFVSMTMVSRDSLKELAGQVVFEAKLLQHTTLPRNEYDQLVSFQKNAADIARTIIGTEKYLEDLMKKVESIKQAINQTPEAPNSLLEKTIKLSKELKKIHLKFERDSDRPSAEETPPSQPTFSERLGVLAWTHWRSTSSVTQKERNAYKILVEEFPPVLNRIKTISEVEVKEIETQLDKYNAPWTPGRLPDMKLK